MIISLRSSRPLCLRHWSTSTPFCRPAPLSFSSALWTAACCGTRCTVRGRGWAYVPSPSGLGYASSYPCAWLYVSYMVMYCVGCRQDSPDRRPLPRRVRVLDVPRQQPVLGLAEHQRDVAQCHHAARPGAERGVPHGAFRFSRCSGTQSRGPPFLLVCAWRGGFGSSPVSARLCLCARSSPTTSTTTSLLTTTTPTGLGTSTSTLPVAAQRRT